MKFAITNKDEGSLARAGVIETAHGKIETPAYIAPATKAALKALSPDDALACGSQAMMMNTYHLMLEPGVEIVRKAGGLHKFGNWAGPIMTDSGGFQAFSLGEAYGTGITKFIGIESEEYRPSQHPKRARFDDDGVTFFSHIDGNEMRITPESSIETQMKLGSDIMFAFDECVSPNAPREKHEAALARTLKWAKRCITAKQENHSLRVSSEKIPRNIALNDSPVLMGIVQGGRYEDLRKQSARDISKLNFDGYGIGGSFVKEDMSTAVRWVTEILPEDKPRHLLGVGEPIDIVLGVENGIDTFDCVASTRKARTGQVYTATGEVNVTNAKYRELMEPIESDCACETCQNYTCAYLHHLFRSHELNAYRLASIHNLYFIEHLFADIRQSLATNAFQEFKKEFLTILSR
ncbi:MAG TPA: tRNA guanosine(34) transglycosylase Tgt [Candidatus Paceibacterota bacterium]